MGGNVGIGTESPSALLSVQKDQAGYSAIRVDNSNTAGFSGLYLNGGNSLAQPAGGFLQWNNNPGVNNLFVATGGANPLYFGTNSSIRMTLLPNSGNFGIGTTSPAAKLDIAGGADNNGAGDQYDIALQYRLGGYRHRISSRHIAGAQAGNAIDFFVWKQGTDAITALGTQHVMTLDGNGNVGVGNMAPAFKFDVAGPVRSSSGGFVFPDGTVQTTAASGASSSGSSTSFWSTPNAGGHINNTNTGNVGIGTSSPNQKLGVQGMLGLYPQAWVAPTGRGMYMMHNGTAGAIYAYNYLAGVGDPIHINGSSVALSTYVNGNSVERITAAANGNVGIGTAAPSQKLHVFGGNIFHQFSTTAGQEWGFYTSINNNHVSSNLYFDGQWKRMTPGKGALISTAPLHGTAFNVIADNTDRAANATAELATLMRVNMDGNVGIGNAAPAYKLDVSGEINATGLRINGTPISAGSGGSSQWTTSGSNIFYNTGNIGVGTTAPAAKLDVTGPTTGNGPTIRAGGGGDVVLASGGSLFFDGNYAYVSGNYIRPMGANTQGFFTSGVERLRITNAGNIGIGTTSPAKTLDVAGDVNVSGTITGGIIVAKYQDVAEWVPSSQKLPAGTVVVLDTDRSNHVMASLKAYDTRVAGVISEQPGVILGEGGEGKLMVATTGRVKIKVDATRSSVRVGDLLVTSDVEGMAMKSEPLSLGGAAIHRPGTLIGKALEALDKGTGEILVLLSLQ